METVMSLNHREGELLASAGGALGPCQASPSAQAAPTTSSDPAPDVGSSLSDHRATRKSSTQWNGALLLFSRSAVGDSLRPHGLWPARLLRPFDFPGKTTGVGCHFLLQGIFPTQGLNLHLLNWQVGSLPLSQQGSPLKGV